MTTQDIKEITIEIWKVELSDKLQALEGMELISPSLRVNIEKTCIQALDRIRKEERKDAIIKTIRHHVKIEERFKKYEGKQIFGEFAVDFINSFTEKQNI